MPHFAAMLFAPAGAVFLRGHGPMQKTKFSTETVRRAWIVRVRGAVVIDNAKEFREQVLEAANAKGPAIMLDLQHVSEMDSAGVAVLIELHRHVQAQGRPLILIGTSPAVTQIISVMRAANVVCDVFRSIHDGLRHTRTIKPGQEAKK